jgi:hypothetical protein
MPKLNLDSPTSVTSGPDTNTYDYINQTKDSIAVRISATGNGWTWADPDENNGVRIVISRRNVYSQIIEEGLYWDQSNQGAGQYFTIEPDEQLVMQILPDEKQPQTGQVGVYNSQATRKSSQKQQVQALGAGGATRTIKTETIPGGGGEPHFVGFDNVFFSYHGNPGEWYLLWDGMNLRIEALFDIEAAAEKYPSFKGTTFITKLYIKQDGNEHHFDAYDPDWNNHQLPNLETQGLVRGLPPQLQLIEGEVHGVKTVPFQGREIVVTQMNYKNEFSFLNLAFSKKEEAPPIDLMNATGILGQTTKPKKLRLPNDHFFLKKK